MKQAVNFHAFQDGFRDYDREENFSYDGLKALFDYLEQLEEDIGGEIEFDVIALYCDYTEYETADEAAGNYFEFEGMSFDEDGNELETAEEVEAKALQFLQDRTQVICFDSGLIIQEF